MITNYLFVFFLLLQFSVYAKDPQSAEEKSHHAAGEEGDHDHASSEEDDHDHTDGESDEEEGKNIGSTKGIVEFSKKDGFKLSPEALKNFDLSYLELKGQGPWILSKSSVVYSGNESNLFRKRNGYFKSVDFRIVQDLGDRISVKSIELQEGDQLALTGLGFLRIAEVAATGGVSHGHTH